MKTLSFPSARRSYGASITKSGFTLIELLVVIAIIAILAAILFPVFGRARENARRTNCLNNLKQIGLGVMQYLQDYDERFPNPYGGTGTFGWADQIQPYIKSTQAFQCPSETTAPDPKPENKGYTDYFYNGGLSSYDETARIQVGRSSALLTNPTLTILGGDSVTENASFTLPRYIDPNNGFGCYGLISAGNATSGNCSNGVALDRTAAMRHLEGANYVFTDGHVKWQKMNTIYGAATDFANSKNNPTFHLAD